MGKRRDPSPAAGWEETARLRGPALAAVASALAAATVYYAGVDAWRLVTLMGETPFYLVSLPIAFHVLGPKRGAGLLASLMLAVAVTDALKELLDMPRPPRELWLVEAEGPGFPSGHASSSTAFWAYLALALPSYYTLIAAIAVPGLVAASRVALNVHYPLDVAGGIAVGLAAALAAYALSERVKPLQLVALSLAVAAPLEAASALRVEVASTLLGGLAGLAAYERLLGDKPLGVKAGLLGSAIAVAAGLPAVAYEDLAVRAISTLAAAVAAITVPALVQVYAKPRGGRGILVPASHRV